MELSQLIRECQDAVGVTPDARPGVQTWTAIHRRLLPQNATSIEAAAEEPVDERSERNIRTLHPRVQPCARALLHAAAAKGWSFKVTSGLRTYAEQDALYAQGRTAPGPKVTNATGGFSNHNFGIAFDVTLFDGKTPLYESPLYKALAAIGIDLGLEWGGAWRSLKDEPHYQLRPAWASTMPEKNMLAELRRRKTAGIDAFATSP